MHLKTLKHIGLTYFDTGMLNYNINMATKITIYTNRSSIFCSGDTFDEKYLSA